MELKIYKFLEKTNVEGPNTRFCIWVQGCNKRCKGCWAEGTWDYEGGQSYSVDELFNKIASTKGIEGVTFLGGEPFDQAKALATLAEKIKSINLSLVTFTGNTMEELLELKDEDVNKLLSYTDLLIDGRFEQDKFDLTRPWTGSSNQRYIFLTDKYSPEILKDIKNKVEIRIDNDGNIFANGMGDFKKLQENLSLQSVNNKVYF